MTRDGHDCVASFGRTRNDRFMALRGIWMCPTRQDMATVFTTCESTAFGRGYKVWCHDDFQDSDQRDTFPSALDRHDTGWVNFRPIYY